MNQLGVWLETRGCFAGYDSLQSAGGTVGGISFTQPGYYYTLNDPHPTNIWLAAGEETQSR